MSTPVIADAPQNLFVVLQGNVAYINFDGVTRDINQNPIKVTEYIVSKSPNSTGIFFDTIGNITTTDSFGETDVFYVDYNGGDFQYRVCPVYQGVVGVCTTGFGVNSASPAPIAPSPAKYDIAKYDIDFYA